MYVNLRAAAICFFDLQPVDLLHHGLKPLALPLVVRVEDTDHHAFLCHLEDVHHGFNFISYHMRLGLEWYPFRNPACLPRP